MTLTEFLLARIAEDEQETAPFECPCDLAVDGVHIAPCPERVLAECEAKRRIVEECQALIDSFGGIPRPDSLVRWPDVSRRERSQAHGRLRTLASVYSDHPDYDEAWRA